MKSDFSPKAVSKLMSHAKELITVDVYGDNSNIIPEEIPELLSYMDDVIPERNEKCCKKTNVLDTAIEVESYLPQTNSDRN